MTILIVEGSDLSGKTTAIEKISKKFKRGILIKNLYKPSVAGDISIYDQYWKIINLIKSYSQNNHSALIILDRFYPSQAVYSILRGKDEMLDPGIISLDHHCSHFYNFIYVYLDTPLRELEYRYGVRGDDYLEFEQLKMIKERYDIFYDLTKMTKIKVNTMESDWLEKLTKFVEERQNEHQIR